MSLTKQTSQRLNNLLKGKVTEKSSTSIGYNQKNVDHKEGDIWEENNKTWTIKNSIKQTISKLDTARLAMPLMCPKCNNLMRGRFDQKAYTFRKVCFDCMIEQDNELMRSGKFAEFEKAEIDKSLKSFIKDLKVSTEEYIKSSTSNSYVTEDGQVEEWSVGRTQEELETIFNKQINEVEKTINS
jgi:hypothetical protein